MAFRKLIVLLPDNRGLQTFFDGRPYGESEVGIRVAVVVAVTDVYAVDLIEEVLGCILGEYVGHSGLYAGAAYCDVAGSFPFLLLGELIISQLDVCQLVGLLRMLRTQCHGAVKISDACLQACVEYGLIHSGITGVHSELLDHRLDAVGTHSVDLCGYELASAADLVGHLLGSLFVIVCYDDQFCPVTLCTGSFDDLCCGCSYAACSDDK